MPKVCCRQSYSRSLSVIDKEIELGDYTRAKDITSNFENLDVLHDTFLWRRAGFESEGKGDRRFA